MPKKKLDIAMETVEKILLEEAANKNEMKPYLEKKLKEIRWVENKQAELSQKREDLLKEMTDLLELAGEISFQLTDGFRARYAHTREVKVEDFKAFMKWIKENKEPKDVMEFLENAVKSGAVKKFVEKEIENQKINGELEPNIDGVSAGAISFRRLTTDHKGAKFEKTRTNDKRRN